MKPFDLKQINWTEMTFKKKVFFLIAIGVFLVLINSLQSDPVVDPKEKDLSPYAFMHAKNYIKTKLVSPATADFPWAEYKCGRSAKGTRYRIYSYVDSENKFGATIRTDYEVMLQYTGGDEADYNNWRIIDAKVQE